MKPHRWTTNKTIEQLSSFNLSFASIVFFTPGLACSYRVSALA
jgi:hypothetical protein